MSLLQFVIIIAAVLFILFGLDLFKRKKMNILHFLIFVLGWGAIAVFALNQSLLDQFWAFFGIARWADLLVYISLILLFYFYTELVNKHTKDRIQLTRLIRNIALKDTQWTITHAKIVFVMPAYNESDIALTMVAHILGKGYGAIFEDDGSANDLYEKMIKKFLGKEFVAIRHDINIGQGGALQTGAEYIKRKLPDIGYVVQFDSDGQHRLEDLPHFIEAFRKDPSLEIVLWSRFLGDTINMPWRKRITLKLWILFTWIFSNIKLTDTHNGYRMIRREALPKLDITMNGMEHASEIIDMIKKKKIRYKEVPIVVIYSEYSKAKGQKIGNAIRIVKNLIYKKLFFR